MPECRVNQDQRACRAALWVQTPTQHKYVDYQSRWVVTAMRPPVLLRWVMDGLFVCLPGRQRWDGTWWWEGESLNTETNSPQRICFKSEVIAAGIREFLDKSVWAKWKEALFRPSLPTLRCSWARHSTLSVPVDDRSGCDCAGQLPGVFECDHDRQRGHCCQGNSPEWIWKTRKFFTSCAADRAATQWEEITGNPQSVSLQGYRKMWFQSISPNPPTSVTSVIPGVSCLYKERR